MTSAFKNFFITFIICLTVFGIVGFKYILPELATTVKGLFFDTEESSSQPEESKDGTEDVSDTTSDETPIVPNYDENGRIFTAVVLAVDSQNRAVDIVFIDANGKTKQYLYCPISPSTKTTNDIGVNVPVGDLFATLSLEEIAQCVSSMTGIQVDYCLKFTRDDLVNISSRMAGPYVKLGDDEVVIMQNPEYEDFIPEEGQEYPDDYYITITNLDNNRVNLNATVSGKSQLEWLLEYNPKTDGSEYNHYYSLINKALIQQYLDTEGDLSVVINNCETNLSLEEANRLRDEIYAYNDYTRHEFDYPSNWEKAVKEFQAADNPHNLDIYN